MKQEIRQNGKTVLYSGDGHSIPMIFNNLVGKNLKPSIIQERELNGL